MSLETILTDEQEIKRLWEQTRGLFNYPALETPEIVDGLKGGAHFDFSSGTTRMSRDYIKRLVDSTDLTVEECFNAIAIHEIGHYMVFPRDLATILLTGKMLGDLFVTSLPSEKEGAESEREYMRKRDEDIQNFMAQTYFDMVDDLSSALDGRKREPILNLRTESTADLNRALDKNIRSVMLAYLHRQAGLECNLDEELEPYFDRMMSIEFLSPADNRHPKDPNKLRSNLFQWGDIVNDMIKAYAPENGFLTIASDGDLNLGDILSRLSEDELREALRQLSDRIHRGEYKRLKKWLQGRGVEIPEDMRADGIDITIGSSRGELTVDAELVQYYKDLSRNYSLVITKKPIEIDDTKRSYEGTDKWSIGKEPLLALPNLSGGKLLPGLTRTIEPRDRKQRITDYDIPHLLIAIDSSGSMDDPSRTKSHAILAGVCAARSYHVRDSMVGVINFSGDSFYLPYTRNLDEAIAGIVSYQGGGTELDLDLLEAMLKPEEFKAYKENNHLGSGPVPHEIIEKATRKQVDVSLPTFGKALESGCIDLVMVTDLGIGNLEETISFFEQNTALNRATIILSGRYRSHDVFDFEGLERDTGKIRVHPVRNEADIPSVVIGDIQRNTLSYESLYHR